MPASTIYPWTPGQAAVGSKVFAEPTIFNGQMQVQRGSYSFPPSVTAPGTVASGGTVVNSTGNDCTVYASATTGISAAKILTYNGANTGTLTVPGSVPAASTTSYVVPGPGAIALTYTGTLTWAWMAIS